MKSEIHGCGGRNRTSPPSRGAWIEIGVLLNYLRYVMSPPSRGAWIEISENRRMASLSLSPPSRGAWIEMSSVCCAQRWT